MITHKGTLPVGVKVDGVEHRDFELRPQLVRDSIEAVEDERAAQSDSIFGLALLAKQFLRLGTLDKSDITIDLLLDAYDADMKVLMEGAASLRERLKTFRDQDTAAEKVADTAAQNRHVVG